MAKWSLSIKPWFNPTPFPPRPLPPFLDRASFLTEEEGKLERGTCGKEFGMVKQTLTSYPNFGLHPLSPYLSLSFSRPCLLPRGEEEGKLEREGWEKELASEKQNRATGSKREKRKKGPHGFYLLRT
jgi:hypothetical protein